MIRLSWVDTDEVLLEDVIDGGWDKHWQSPDKLDLVAHQQGLQKGDHDDSDAESVLSSDLSKLEMKLRVDLISCDSNGEPSTPLNKQSTYLHIQRCDECWLLRVDKRIGYIGSNHFNLHEIYGLSSHTRDDTTDNTPSNDIKQSVMDEHVGGECVICLASPRDTLLLPCRHLVACKDCAHRMTDFGGGATQPDREGGIWGQENSEPSTSTPPAPTNPSNEAVSAAEAGRAQRRRKRKPKGWYCPICRQPYSAMLRVAFKDQQTS